MKHFLPHHWVERGGAPQIGAIAATRDVSAETFSSQVLRNEAFTFQLVLVSGREPLTTFRSASTAFPIHGAKP